MPRNTQRIAEQHPIMVLAEAMGSGGMNSMVERQEAQGQRELVTDDTLPVDMNQECKSKLEDAGVVFGDTVAGDRLFRLCKLPAGWKKVATDHSMWSDLVDDQGVKRASIFYKAAFYDRRASLTAV